MSPKELCHFCSEVESEEVVTNCVAAEAKRMVLEAAMPIPAGETVKGQLRRAARALGYRDGDWRIRTAWYGHAGAWSASAFMDLKRAYMRMKEKRAWAERTNDDRIEQDICQRIAAIEQWALATDPDFFGEAVSRLRAAASQGRETSARMAEQDRALASEKP